MGDREQFDDPTSVVTSNNAAEEPSSSRHPSDSQPAESQANVDNVGMRRSSIRPAPLGFKPIARDPSTLRPAMVIHAGDADLSAPAWDAADPAPSHPSMPAIEAAILSAGAHSEPFSLAEDLRSDPAAVLFPPAAGIPHEALEPRDPRNEARGAVSADAPPRTLDPNPTDTIPTDAIPRDAVSAPVIGAPTLADREGDTSHADARAHQTAARDASDATAHKDATAPVDATTADEAAAPREARAPSAPNKQLSFRTIAAVAIPLLLVGVIAVTLLGRSQAGAHAPEPASLGNDNPSSPTPALQQQAVPSPELAAQATPEIAEQATPESAAPARTPPQVAATQAAIRDQAPSNAPRAAHAVSSSHQVTTKVASVSPPPNTTRVTLELKPVDAKVFLRGATVPGPPYVFDVRKGERITVEVIRFGFVTRKVTITDKKPVLSIGMVRNRFVELTH